MTKQFKIRPITKSEFEKIKTLIYKWAGIHITETKKSLISSRLFKRLNHFQVETYDEYIDIILNDKTQNEHQNLINILTTNETSFFREEKHFNYIKDHILPKASRSPFNVWSAACSIGSEVYTTGMLLFDHFGVDGWTILGSDINLKVIEKARSGVYNIKMADRIPPEYLKKYCLKGVRTQEGKFSMNKIFCKNISFQQINLIKNLPDIGTFDIIFLRNVMIYFNSKTKIDVVNSVLEKLNHGGYLFIGHAENLNDFTGNLKRVLPAIYCKE